MKKPFGLALVLFLLVPVLGSTARAQTGLSAQWFVASTAGDGTNGEQEYYSPSQVSVNNGYVQLTAINQATGGLSYTSGRIVWSTLNFTYGEVQYRAKYSGGVGTWPSLWLLGSDCQPAAATILYGTTGDCTNWPKAGSNEIDITEIKNGDYTHPWQNVISSTGAWATCQPTVTDVSQNFHVYDFTWSPTALTWYIDGVQTCKVTASAYIPSTPMYVILNVALGGMGGGTVKGTTLPQTAYFDYVRVYSGATFPPTGNVIFDDEFGSDTGLPDPPTSLQASSTTNSVALTWTASPSASVTYTVLRRATTNDPFTEYAVGVAATTYTDSNVIPGVGYDYEVEAVNSVGTGVPSIMASATIPVPGQAPAISIDFVGSGTAMAGSETAGVIAKSHWNNANATKSSSPLALMDETGTLTGATATWVSDTTGNASIVDQAGNQRMMRGFIGRSNSTTFAVSGLPSNTYDVYVYADGNNGSSSRTGAYQISGAGIATASINLTDAANTDFSGTFTQAANSNGNYVKFAGITATGFTLTVTPQGSSSNSRRASLNGIQIVPTAPPSPDFTISATPSSNTVSQTGSTTYTVSVGASNGFSGSVDLSVSGLPAGASASFNPASVTSSNSSTLTITTSSTPVGSPTLSITGTSGTLTHFTNVTLVVQPPPDFTISATPSSRTVNQTGSTTYTVSIGALNGFSGSVDLTATGLPAGASASFSPTPVTGSSNSTLTVITSGTPAGSSSISITGTSGTLTRSINITLVVQAPDFTISATPSSRTVNQTGSTTYAVSIGALNGFSGSVDLTATGLPAGASASFNPASVTGAGSSTLTITTSSTPVGSSTISVTGTSGTLTRSTNVTMIVSVAGVISVDFVGRGTAMGTAETAGVVARNNWNNAAGTTGSLNGLVNENGAATSAAVSWSSYNVWSTAITDTVGNLRMMKGYLDNGNQNPITVTVSGLAARTYDVYVYVDGDNGSASRIGAYAISGTGVTTTTVNLTDPANSNFNGTFTQAINSNGNYVKFTGVTATGFKITATPGQASDSTRRAPVNAIQIVPTS